MSTLAELRAASRIPSPGHQAAQTWYQNLDRRLAESSPYCVASGLREAFDSIGRMHRGDFLDAVGDLFVTWKTAGEPAGVYAVSDADIVFNELSAADQDRAVDLGLLSAQGSSHEASEGAHTGALEPPYSPHLHPLADRLEALLSQASSLVLITHGVCGEAFQSLHDRDQENILWTLAEMVKEIDTITRQIIWPEGGAQ